MSDDDNRSFSLEALKAAEKARLLEQFEREFEREWNKDWAEAQRLAAKYPASFAIIAPGGPKPQRTLPPNITVTHYGPVRVEPNSGPTGPVSGPLTVKGLIDFYKSDPESGYQKLKFRTRENYDSLLRRIVRDVGLVRVANFDAHRIKEQHEKWCADGHIAMAHSLIRMLRALSTFGATWLKSQECRDLKSTLNGMRFKSPPARNEWLTTEHANAVRAKAHELGFPSVALAQAFQFDCMLSQRNVIGEWVPQAEPGVSDVIDGEMKWLRGLRWSEIDNDLVLTRPAANGGKPAIWRLSDCPMVMAEFDRLGARRDSGPIINYERTRKPYNTQQFRWLWRKVADAAGIPKTVKNMDSRKPAPLEQHTSRRKRETDSAL